MRETPDQVRGANERSVPLGVIPSKSEESHLCGVGEISPPPLEFVEGTPPPPPRGRNDMASQVYGTQAHVFF